MHPIIWILSSTTQLGGRSRFPEVRAGTRRQAPNHGITELSNGKRTSAIHKGSYMPRPIDRWHRHA